MGIEQFLLNKAKEEGIKEGIKTGKKVGIKEGKEEGKEQTTLEVIKNAHQKGLAIDLIAEIVNLPIDEVRKILEELGLNQKI